MLRGRGAKTTIRDSPTRTESSAKFESWGGQFVPVTTQLHHLTSALQQSDDIEDQIEASIISFSSGENDANKRITIKFKKERTVETPEIVPVPQATMYPRRQQRYLLKCLLVKKKRKQSKYSVLSMSSYDKTLTPHNDSATKVEDFLLSYSTNDDSALFTLMGTAQEDQESSMSNNEFRNSVFCENNMQGYTTIKTRR